ncbi:hypothetical protein H0H92_001463 [Tricholoma furcatifolium]|nr:hypothetical protein H0H92_001463 [Tricholoma furcatifolium]
MSDPPPPSNITLPSSPNTRHAFLDALLAACTPSDLQYLSTALSPLFPAASPSTKSKSDDLPPELWLLVFGYVEHPAALLRLGTVCRAWGALVREERVWRGLCLRWGFMLGTGGDGDAMGRFRRGFTKIQDWKHGGRVLSVHGLPLLSAEHPQQPQALQHTRSSSSSSQSAPPRSSPRRRVPTPTSIPPSTSTSHTDTPSPDTGVVTSLALDGDWVVAGLASARIHVFSARTGVLARTLVGHEAGVWGLCLVSAGGVEDPRGGVRVDGGGAGGGDGDDRVDQNSEGEGERNGEEWSGQRYRPERQSSPTHASVGWGQPRALVVSGGCDKVVRVWDVLSGTCLHALRGHTSTIRCMRVLHNRPLALTGARDATLRTWDIRTGTPGRVFEGHTASVRCVDVNGCRAVSGSYDATARIWDLDTGECLHVLRGHYQQVYAVAFDGVRVATGGMDTTVRVWDAETGHCLALLQEQTGFVCALQLSRAHGMLVTGGSDGRIVAFSLGDEEVEAGEGMFDFEWAREADRGWRVRKVRGGKARKGNGKGKGREVPVRNGNGSSVSLSMYAQSPSSTSALSLARFNANANANANASRSARSSSSDSETGTGSSSTLSSIRSSPSSSPSPTPAPSPSPFLLSPRPCPTPSDGRG